MCPKHRSEILAEIHIKVKNNQPVILIATSCIECGVDLDFPIAYREIAPLASIIQAAGRCNRNGLRPVEQSIVTVFEIEGAKYNDGIFNYGINKTKYLLAFISVIQ
jgi:CRISPR/Cas system-associated endonuclease/helicase Cas3